MLKMQEIAFPGFKFQTFSGGVCPQTPLGIHAWYVGHMAITHQYSISQKGPFSKNAPPPPTGKSLKKGGPGKISNKVVYVHCVSKAVGQTDMCNLGIGDLADVEGLYRLEGPILPPNLIMMLNSCRQNH